LNLKIVALKAGKHGCGFGFGCRCGGIRLLINFYLYFLYIAKHIFSYNGKNTPI